ncbi:MAG: DPP IV N-terminal domain-containing protein [Prevotella sp.]
MTMKKIKTMMAMATLVACQHTLAQKQFTLEDINFGGNNFYNLQPKNMYLTWWGDQLMYQDAEESGTVDMKSGKTKALFNIKDLGEGWHSAMNARYPYQDQTVVLLDNGKERVLYDWKKRSVVWRQDSKEQRESQWNKHSKATAFVRNNQLHVITADNKTRQLTTDGSRELVYGKTVHRNEFGIEKGIFWSPNGERFAFYRMDQSMVADYPQVDIFHPMAQPAPDKYPMAGQTSHKVTVGVYDLQTDKTIYLQAGDPTDRYFTNIAWAPDSKRIYMFELNRDQNDCRLVCYNAETGEKQGEIYRETDSKYVEPLHPILFLPWQPDQFILQSQRDGFNHLYIYNVKGEQVKQLTQGAYVVENILGFDKKNKRVIIASNEKHVTQRNLYAVDIKTGKKTALDNGRGFHYAALSKSGSWLYEKYTEPTVPRVINLTNTTNAKALQLLKAEDPWKEYVTPQFSIGTIKAADGVTDLYYRMVRPADFDESRKYPTVVYVYGGPHAYMIESSWHYASRSWETYMAQKGYIVFVLDNRGSERRGKEFEQVTFRQLGQVEMADQMKGVEFLKSLPYVDTDRMGVHGWSFGGFMTISLLTNYPDVFKVGVAGGPVIDWKWYEVMYGERYMDTPQANAEGYEKTSLMNKAKDLKGKLQIIIGYNDDTVVPQHALSFINACTEAGTQPDLFVYPGEGHNMMGHKSVHLHERITQYFEDYLK